MPIDPRALRTYLAVCRAGSISRAARQLNISQPSVSVSVAQLETSLGTLLFARTRSGIVLTAAGSALRRKAEAMEALLRAAEQEVELAAQDVIGPLVIGGTPGALASLVPDGIARFRMSHPRFNLQIVERPDPALVDLLRSEQIDVAIVTTGIEAVPEDLVEESVAEDELHLIVGPANSHLPGSIRLGSLRDIRWVLPDAIGAFRRQVDAIFLAAQVPMPANAIRCDSLLTTKAVVRQTDCITILPNKVAADELAMGALRAIEIEDARLVRQVGVRRLKRRLLSSSAEEFLAAIRAAFEP